AVSIAPREHLHPRVVTAGDQPTCGLANGGAGDDVVDMMLVRFDPRDCDEGGDGVRRKPDFPTVAILQGRGGREALRRMAGREAPAVAVVRPFFADRSLEDLGHAPGRSDRFARLDEAVLVSLDERSAEGRGDKRA